MTPEIWKASVAAIQSADEAPEWLKRQACLSYEEALRLPLVDVAGDGVDVTPNVEKRLLKTDYFDFLREQIHLEPRGAEWNEILRKRLTSLEPFVGKQLIRVTFHSKPHEATLEVNPDTWEAVHLEVN